MIQYLQTWLAFLFIVAKLKPEFSFFFRICHDIAHCFMQYYCRLYFLFLLNRVFFGISSLHFFVLFLFFFLPHMLHVFNSALCEKEKQQKSFFANVYNLLIIRDGIFVCRGLKYVRNIPTNPTIYQSIFDKRGTNMGIKTQGFKREQNTIVIVLAVMCWRFSRRTPLCTLNDWSTSYETTSAWLELLNSAGLLKLFQGARVKTNASSFNSFSKFSIFGFFFKISRILFSFFCCC